MTKPFARSTARLAVVGGSLLLQGCVVGAVVGTGAAVVGGTDVMTFKNQTEIQRVGKGTGMSRRCLPLTAIKCSNCS